MRIVLTVIIVFIVSLVTFPLVYLLNSLLGLGDIKLSLNGYIALALCIFFIFILTAGLMFLVFFSSRKGYDDEVNN